MKLRVTNICHFRLMGLLGSICLLRASIGTAEEPITIEPVERWTNVFSGSEVKFHYTVLSAQPFDARVNWSLSVNQRTVKHGQMPLTAKAGHATEVTVTLKVPKVKDSVILESDFRMALYSAGNQEPSAEHVRKVWIFAADPFASRGEWLKGLKITLFDPEKNTTEVLEKASVPFAFTNNISALDALNDGMLVIGEGTNWKDHPLLGETMVKAAARGVPVLCLAPGEGNLLLPGIKGADVPQPASLTLRRGDMIQELDKRLDAVAWPPKDDVNGTFLSMTNDRDRVVMVAGPSPSGWSWLELQYPERKSRLLVCGFPIIRRWEETPAPRYLLSVLFQRLTAGKQQPSTLTQEGKNGS